MEDFTIKELKEIVTTLKEAYKKAIASGGVTSYTLKSGQGESTVTQASLSTISSELTKYTTLLNERTEIESGSHCTFLRTWGV